MILTKLYRLQKKKGAVLFVVIAMMTLLVIMATTAYMTARSSYKTVVNNYDFSQLYLSAVSVSDMLIGAVTNDTVDKGSGAKNNFDDLRDAIVDTGFSVGSKITAKSSNITSDMDSVEKILAGTVNNPVEAGVLDAVEVVITHESRITKDTLTGDEKDKNKFYDYYLFTTTAYYRNNTVSIQDRVAREWGQSADPTLFDTFFTATGKKLNGDTAEDDLSRCAVIATFDISDDAFFENEYTVFSDDGSGNTFKGGITSAGTVWLDQFNCDIPDPTDLGGTPPKGTRNDWFIGGSMIFGGNAQQWDIGGNNLYVKGDLILLKNMNTFKAANVYVTGNVIDLSGDSTSKISTNIHVNGAFISDLDVTRGTEKQIKIKQNALNTINNAKNAYQSTMTEAGKTPNDLTKNSYFGKNSDKCGFELQTYSAGAGKTESYKLYVNNEADSNLVKDAQNKKKISNSGTWDPVTTTVTTEQKKMESDGYETYLNYDKNVTSAVDGETTRSNYFSYSASDTTMANNFDINFAISAKDTTTKYYLNGIEPPPKTEAELEAYNKLSDAEKKAKDAEEEAKYPSVKVTVDSAGKATVDLPYVPGGYVLDLNFSSQKFDKIDYNIDSGDSNSSVLPIVLKANYNDASSNSSDSRGYNAFNWNVSKDHTGKYGPTTSTQDNRTRVMVDGKGDVFFEMGNYTPGGEYSKFTPGKGLATATYVASEQAFVGTKEQFDAIAQEIVNNSTADTPPQKNSVTIESPSHFDVLFESATSSDTLSQYDNKIMLISNKAGGVSMRTTQQKSVFCGYFYAPFSTYDAYCGSKTTPVCGGMIVSDYITHQSSFVYAEPDPQLIKNLETALPTKTDTSSAKEDLWYTNDAYLGVGSNFLG